MRRSATFSAVLHGVIALLAFFGMPSLFVPDEPLDRMIPVELYIVADETVVPPPALEPVPEPIAEAPPLPPAPEVAEQFIPPPSEPVPAPPAPPEPEPEVAMAPEPAPPAPTPAPPVPEQSEIPPPPPAKPVYVATAEPAPETVPEEKPPPPEAFDSLLTSLEEAARDAPTLEASMAEANAAETPPVTAPTASLSDEPLSLSVVNAIRRQVEDNWSLPAGATDAGDLVVEIEIVLMIDGKVRNARIVDSARLGQVSEGFFKSMAESAVRAVWRASPLRDLPPEKYEQWREITFLFRPPV